VPGCSSFHYGCVLTRVNKVDVRPIRTDCIDIIAMIVEYDCRSIFPSAYLFVGLVHDKGRYHSQLDGVPEFVIVRQTGRRTVGTLRRFIRSGKIFSENAAAEVFNRIPNGPSRYPYV
jgi:hypothetical protein